MGSHAGNTPEMSTEEFQKRTLEGLLETRDAQFKSLSELKRQSQLRTLQMQNLKQPTMAPEVDDSDDYVSLIRAANTNYNKYIHRFDFA